MPNIKDTTLVDWLVDENNLSQEKAWSVALELVQRDKDEKGEKAPKKRSEWLVVVADPTGTFRDDMVGFVVQKKHITKDENMDETDEERMWGDLEASTILKSAFSRTHTKVKGIPTFTNLLRASKKLLKDEYGFDIKTKEGCFIAPIIPANVGILEWSASQDEDDETV